MIRSPDERAGAFRARADEFRAVADTMDNGRAVETLRQLAADYDRMAERAEAEATAGRRGFLPRA